MPLPSLLDEEYLALSRAHIDLTLRRLPLEDKSLRILEIGPKLGWPHFDTLDIDPAVKPTILADVCDESAVPHLKDKYDLVLCISVIEHVYRPQQAIRNIWRLVKTGGRAIFQAPLNFRQHGPQPDLWRFTENGWRWLLRDWWDVEIDVLDTPERPLFPIAYMVTATARSIASTTDFKPKWIER